MKKQSTIIAIFALFIFALGATNTNAQFGELINKAKNKIDKAAQKVDQNKPKTNQTTQTNTQQTNNDDNTQVSPRKTIFFERLGFELV